MGFLYDQIDSYGKYMDFMQKNMKHVTDNNGNEAETYLNIAFEREFG